MVDVMSIDARICGVRVVDGVCKLTLEPRSRREAPAGQETLVVRNPPTDIRELESLVGREIWGCSSGLYIGDTFVAIRHGYTEITLLDEWKGALHATGQAGQTSE